MACWKMFSFRPSSFYKDFEILLKILHETSNFYYDSDFENTKLVADTDSCLATET